MTPPEPRMRIPESQVASLAQLAAMGGADLAALQTALSGTVESADRSSLVQAARSALPTFDNIEDLVDTLATLEILRTSHGYTPESTAGMVAGARELGLDENGRGLLREALGVLLGAPALSVAAKALDLSISSERVFHTARVVTDVRPIFRDDVSEPPLGAVLVHSLEVAFFSDDGVRSLYLALTDSDLTELKQVLTRAQDKADGLRPLLLNAGLPVFDPNATTDDAE